MKLKDYRGVAIEVLPDGRFAATFGGRETVRTQLRHLEALIDGAAQPVRALHIREGYGGFSCAEVLVVRHMRGGKVYRTERGYNVGDSYSSGEVVARFDPVLLAHLRTLTARRTALEAEWRAAVRGAVPLTPEELKAAPAEADQPDEDVQGQGASRPGEETDA